MGQPVARLGDRVVGRCHHGRDDCPHQWSGTIIGGSDNVITEGNPQARLGDKVQHNCPHCGTGTIIEGSGSVLNQQGLAHINDEIITPAGKGRIVGSADSVLAD